MMTVSEVAALLRANDNFLLLTHTRPDGDTLCSAAALCSALRRIGKYACMRPNCEITENYQEMTAPYMAREIPDEAFTVCIDVAGPEMMQLGFHGDVQLCIDHHPGNPGFAAATIVKPEKASCGEIVLEIIEELCAPLTKEEANLLYAAVSTDSGCFCYANTTAETLRAAAHLIDCGAESQPLNKLLFRSSTFARLKLEGLIFSSLRSYRDHKLNVALVTLEMMAEAGAVENDCEDLANLPGRIRGSIVNITIRELGDGRCKASVRTNDQVDASAICAKLGGGGHKMASGCTMVGSAEEMEQALLAAVNEVWPE